MKVVTGQVVDGKVVVEQDSLTEGARVTVLESEVEAGFELGPTEEAELLAAIDEAKRGEVTPASTVLQRLAEHD